MFDLIQSGDFHALGEYVVIRVSITMVCWLFMVLATLVDFWSGVTTAKALKEPLMSHGFRRTITKISDYWRVLLFALMIDILGAFLSFYYLPFLSMLCTLAIVIIEARSVVENSNRRRSHAAEVPSVVSDIVGALTKKDAMKAAKRVITLYEQSKKH
jgi:hypothetical protein